MVVCVPNMVAGKLFSEVNPGEFRIFTQGNCDKCFRVVEEANVFTLFTTAAELWRRGCYEAHLPSEEVVPDVDGTYGCTFCTDGEV